MNHQKGGNAMPAPSSIAWNPSNAGTEETAEQRLDLLTKSMVGEYSTHLKNMHKSKWVHHGSSSPIFGVKIFQTNLKAPPT